MANEKRLIDANKAQAVLANMAEHLMEAGNPEMAGAVGYAAEVIGKQPAVDAVEVVRCENCENAVSFSWTAAGEKVQGFRCMKDEGAIGYKCCVSGDDFCSSGKRRVDDAGD